MNARIYGVFVGLAVILAASSFGAQKAADRGSGTKDAAGPDLSGVWQGWVVNGKGENPNAGTTHLELTIKGNTITAQRLDGAGGSLGQGVFQITSGPSGTMIMDAKKASRGKPEVYLGVCSATGDELKWCVSTGKRRPSSFESNGRDQFFLILKKQK